MTETPRDCCRRVGQEEAFSLVELVVVLVVLAILVSAAVASYISFRDRSNDTTAKANVRTLVAQIESYFADNQTYAGMTPAGLAATYNQAIDPTKYAISGTTATTYCVQSSYGGQTWRKNGPDEPLEALPCP